MSFVYKKYLDIVAESGTFDTKSGERAKKSPIANMASAPPD